MSLKLLDILKKEITEQGGGFKFYTDPQGRRSGEYYGSLKMDDSGKVIDVLPPKKISGEQYELDGVWPIFCNKILDQIEGGYFNYDCGHPSVREEADTETMFGIDRVAGKWDNTSEGKEFFDVIDDEKIKYGAKKKGSGVKAVWSNMNKFCEKWVWLYKGGELNGILKDKACALMKKSMISNMSNFTDNALNVLKSDKRIYFHFSYACWNGSGNFAKWAKEFNQEVEKTKDSESLVNFCVNQRNNWASGMSEGMQKANDRVVDIIKNDSDLQPKSKGSSDSEQKNAYSNEDSSITETVSGTYSASGKTSPYDAVHSFEKRSSDKFGGGLNTKVNAALKKMEESGVNADIKSLEITIDPATLRVNWVAKLGPSSDGYSYTEIDSRGSAGGGYDAAKKQVPAMNKIHNNMEPVLFKDFNIDLTKCFDSKGKKLSNCVGTINIRQLFYKYRKK